LDLVNKLSLENGGRLFVCVATRDEYPRYYKDDQRCFELESVYMGLQALAGALAVGGD
jgi:hypothetical protein